MKTIALVNEIADPTWERALTSNLVEVLGDELEISAYSYDRLGPGDTIQADLVLVLRQSRVANLPDYVRQPRRILVLTRTIRQQAIQGIFSIPAGATVLVVNDSNVTTMEAVGLFMQLDINHIHFVPYQKGLDCSQFKYAITPGEPAMVPKGIETVIDVGHRCIDISSFIEIMRRLDITGHEVNERLLRYSDKIITLDHGVNHQYKDLFLKNIQLNAVIDMSREGVLLLNPRKEIVLYNRSLASMLSLPADPKGFQPEAAPAAEILTLLDGKKGQDWLLDYKGRSLVVTRQTIKHFGETTGYCYNIQEVSYLRQLEQNLSRKLQESGLSTRYTFKDVLTHSQRMKRCVDLARKIAGSDLTVLISGESGTGKELLAQSIHNGSGRKNFPFVAVNCAAMPETLLESELFGYEGGTFTGARKEGKIGLFEQANNGTVFLDELADMSIMLQAKLLRVLQERQITRLGSQRVIDVNIRVIAATNKNLRQQVQAGGFRRDLYYRLNAVTIRVPPLRERQEDILPLVHSVLAAQGKADLHFTDDAKKVLMEYAWPGNVRELKNMAEFLAFMAPNPITLADLPNDLVEAEARHFYQEEQYLSEHGGLSRARALMVTMLEGSLMDRGAGRKSLERALAAQGQLCSEAEVRLALRSLSQVGLVQSSPGRRGSVLTPRGRLFLDWLDSR